MEVVCVVRAMGCCEQVGCWETTSTRRGESDDERARIDILVVLVMVVVHVVARCEDAAVEDMFSNFLMS